MTTPTTIPADMQPFQRYHELSDLLAHAAANWKTDSSSWNKLLHIINVLCLNNEALNDHCAALAEALEELGHSIPVGAPHHNVYLPGFEESVFKMKAALTAYKQTISPKQP